MDKCYLNSQVRADEVCPLVSVIIPVYNVEAYLPECLESVVNQTYTNLEIVLVDDGSPDRCGLICDEYASRDKRIKVIHRLNGGLSAARNSGLEIASGDFICFLDSDDWMDKETIGGYMKLFREYPELDLIESEVYFTREGSVSNVGECLVNTDLEGRILNQRELFYRFTVIPYTNILSNVWNKCYKKELIGTHRFLEGRVMEDIEFNLRLYAGVRNYMRWSRVNYYYRLNREGAITEHTLENTLSVLKILYENMSQIILDIEANIENGCENPSGLISLREHRDYVASRLMTDLIFSPLIEKPECRQALYKIQKPYVEMMKTRPYLSDSKYFRFKRRLMFLSFKFYMYCFVPLYYLMINLRNHLFGKR